MFFLDEEEWELLPRDAKHNISKGMIKILRPLIYADKTRSAKDEEEFYSTYKNTLQRHGFENTFESELLSPLYKLAKYDKIYEHRNNSYFVKLDFLLMLLRKHLTIIEDIKKLPKDSSPRTSYSKHEKFIQKDINELQTTLRNFEEINKGEDFLYDEAYSKTYKTLKFTINLMELYIEEPLQFSFLLSNFNNPKYKSTYLGWDKYIKDYSDKVYSCKLKLDSIHITKSFNLQAIFTYRNASIHNILLKIDKAIEDSELIKLLGEVVEKVLDKNTKPNLKNLTAGFKTIDLIDDTLIIQPVLNRSDKESLEELFKSFN